MSRTYKDRGYRRKKVRNAFLQKICETYSDDFKGRRSRYYTKGQIRARLKRKDKKIIEVRLIEKVDD